MAKRVPVLEQFKISPQLRQDIHDRFVAGLGDPSSPVSRIIDLLATSMLAEVLAEVLAERASQAPVRGGPVETRSAGLTNRKVTLVDWAARHYDPPPSLWTLRQWVRAGQIVPAPEKVGKSYFVMPDAQRITDATPTGALAEYLNSLTYEPGLQRRRRR